MELVGMKPFSIPDNCVYEPLIQTSDISALIQAITEQTKALNALAESNQTIVDAMLQSEGVEPENTGYQTLD
jgi:hypothetical protein